MRVYDFFYFFLFLFFFFGGGGGGGGVFKAHGRSINLAYLWIYSVEYTSPRCASFVRGHMEIK